MKKSRVFAAAIVLSAVAALSGCKKSNDNSGPVAINANCPVMTKNAVSTKVPTVDYNGVTIGFCCEECIDTWNEWTDEKKAEFVRNNTPSMMKKYGDPEEVPEH